MAENPSINPAHARGNDLLAEAAVAEIEPGMIVGLGTGLTAARAIRALASRVRRENLAISCVCTSAAAENLARDFALPILDFSRVESVDYLFDGADEIDHAFRMLKGQHGALASQRLVARASKRNIYLVGEVKFVERLGESATLPIAVLPYALSFIRCELRNLGFSGILRRKMDGEPFVSDLGHMIIDASLNGRDPADAAALLDEVPGVVDHGLFLDEADELLIENKDGSVRHLARA